MKSSAWFGYGSREAYHKAMPYVVLFRSRERCKYKNRYTVGAFRFASDEEARAFTDDGTKHGGHFLAQVHAPTSNGFEGYAESEYPNYALEK